MKSLAEIQRAHDILFAFVNGEPPILKAIMPDEFARAAHASLDVLCWMLEHEHKTNFRINLATLEKMARDVGCILMEQPPAG